MAEFTKGDWKVWRTPTNYQIRVTNTGGDKNEDVVADIYSCHIGLAKNNAHLIAAAPAMYEALKEARITLRVLQPSGSAVLRKIDSALAEAEGR